MYPDPRRPERLVWRYLLTDRITGPPSRVWRVAELVDDLRAAGFALDDAPSRMISNLLRAEVARGRVVRVGWGRYGPGTIPGSTRRRIRNRAGAARAAVAAAEMTDALRSAE
ncbi:hypothetical protein [Actinospongicola halichondriae]|uniref:hypothetical protein n=1 Tax=Actinospongicola halichondriae TaxID=3236844 RepID=UPI003D47F77F